MSELKTYMDDDRDETCPFCGKVYPGEDEEEYEDWWAATECEHMCCLECSNWTAGYPLCPQSPRRKVSVTVNQPDPSGQKARQARRSDSGEPVG